MPLSALGELFREPDVAGTAQDSVMSALFLGHPCWPVLSTAPAMICSVPLRSLSTNWAPPSFFLLDELASKSYNPRVLPTD